MDSNILKCLRNIIGEIVIDKSIIRNETLFVNLNIENTFSLTINTVIFKGPMTLIHSAIQQTWSIKSFYHEMKVPNDEFI